MIDHEEYRRALLSEPNSLNSELLAHRDGCAECRVYSEGVLRFETRLQRALAVDVPVAPGRPVSPDNGLLAIARRPRRTVRAPRWLALAASMLVAALVVGVGWLAAPRPSLAAAVVAHMAGEPDAWRVSATPVPAPQLSGVLQNAKMRLLPAAGTVSYAHSCRFRGYVVPHLVVQSARGPVTVMVLVHENVRQPVKFQEQGFSGTIVPVPGHGSIAVLMRGAQTPAEIGAVAARVRGAVEWSGV